MSREVHPLFRTVFDDWQRRAGVRSAQPDAPVEPEKRRRGLRVRRRVDRDGPQC